MRKHSPKVQAGGAEGIRTPDPHNAIDNKGVTSFTISVAGQDFQVSINPGGTSVVPKSVRLDRVVREVVQAKYDSGRRVDYVKGLRWYLEMFAQGRESAGIDTITTDDIEAWFATRGESAVARQSNLGRLGALFSYAVRKGYLSASPVARVERVRVERKTPQILPVDAVEGILRTAQKTDPGLIPYLVLAVFAGVRPYEILRLTWDHIRLDRSTVEVPASASKVHRRRIVHLLPTAVAWLKLGGDLPVHNFRRRWRGVRGRSGVTWGHDILRHTAASHWLEHTRNAAAVALELGTSERMLMVHYRELVTEGETEEFYGITP